MKLAFRTRRPAAPVRLNRRPAPGLALALALCAAVAGASLHAQPATPSDAHDGHQHPAAASTASEAAWVQGEVRRIDAENGKLTLKHEAIARFDMGPMTMAFRVAKPALLDGLAVGDQVKFRVEKIDQRVMVVDLQKLN